MTDIDTSAIPKKRPRGFQKGQSGNPGGRPKSTRSLEERRIINDVRLAAKQYTPEALKVLDEIMRDKKAPKAARIMAANSLLDRGHGKPSQSIDVNSETPLTFMQVVEMSLAVPREQVKLPDWIESTRLGPGDFTPDGRLLPLEDRPRRRVIEGEIAEAPPGDRPKPQEEDSFDPA